MTPTPKVNFGEDLKSMQLINYIIQLGNREPIFGGNIVAQS